MDSTGWITIQSMIIKTANKKDLAVDSALQCALLTQTKVSSRDGSLDTSEAQAGIDVRIRVTEVDGNTLAEIASSQRFADPNGEAGVTYCDRRQLLEAQFAGTECFVDTSDPGDPMDPVVCLDDETLNLVLETLNAHAFNFLVVDVAAATHKVQVQARARALSSLGGTKKGSAKATAATGLGSTLVEEIRLIKGNDGSNVPEI